MIDFVKPKAIGAVLRFTPGHGQCARCHAFAVGADSMWWAAATGWLCERCWLRRCRRKRT